MSFSTASTCGWNSTSSSQYICLIIAKNESLCQGFCQSLSSWDAIFFALVFFSAFLIPSINLLASIALSIYKRFYLLVINSALKGKTNKEIRWLNGWHWKIYVDHISPKWAIHPFCSHILWGRVRTLRIYLLNSTAKPLEIYSIHFVPINILMIFAFYIFCSC